MFLRKGRDEAISRNHPFSGGICLLLRVCARARPPERACGGEEGSYVQQGGLLCDLRFVAMFPESVGLVEAGQKIGPSLPVRSFTLGEGHSMTRREVLWNSLCVGAGAASSTAPAL